MRLNQRATHLATLMTLAVYTFAALNHARAAPTVLNFDDLSNAEHLASISYGGLTWETGIPGMSGQPGVWIASIGGHPHSLPMVLVNGNGSTQMGIGFPSPVQMGGMYVAVQGNASDAWAGGLQIHGFSNGLEVAISDAFAPITTTPRWFDLSGLPQIDRIVIYALGAPPTEPVGVYGLDDLTFTYVPEPVGIPLGLLALGGLLLRRKRRWR